MASQSLTAVLCLLLLGTSCRRAEPRKWISRIHIFRLSHEIFQRRFVRLIGSLTTPTGTSTRQVISTQDVLRSGIARNRLGTKAGIELTCSLDRTASCKPPTVLDGFQWVAIVVQDVDLLKDPETRDRANVLGAIFAASAIRSTESTPTQLADLAKTTSKPVIWDPMGRHSEWVLLEELLPVLPQVEPRRPQPSLLVP